MFWFFLISFTSTIKIYTLSLHDALPILMISISPLRKPTGEIVGASAIARDISAQKRSEEALRRNEKLATAGRLAASIAQDRKSTRLNSSHSSISYAVLCLKKKKKHGVVLLHVLVFSN